MGAADTKTRLLDAGERLFSERGFKATSLRDLTREAGANLAAVNYHFGSKHALFGEVLDRRLGPLNRERLRHLEAACDRAAPAAPETLDLLAALIRPWAALVQESDERGVRFVRLLGRAHFEPDPELRQILVEAFREVTARFGEALHRAQPLLSRRESVSRMFFCIGAMTLLADVPLFREFATDEEQVAGVQDLVEHMLGFLAAGFDAPATEPA